MFKKMIAASLAAVMAVSMFSTGVMAEPSGEKVSAGEIQFEIPAKYQGMLTVKTEGLEPNTLVEVSETKSIEAAQKKEQNTDGAGMLFSISRISENELRKLRCDNMDGMEVFAEDDDMYYLFNHPTDVRIYREDNISDAINSILILSGIPGADRIKLLHVFRISDTAFLDMSGQFVSALESIGQRKRLLLLTGIVRTLQENFSPLLQVRFLIDSKPPKSGGVVDLSVPWKMPNKS